MISYSVRDGQYLFCHNLKNTGIQVYFSGISAPIFVPLRRGSKRDFIGGFSAASASKGY